MFPLEKSNLYFQKIRYPSTYTIGLFAVTATVARYCSKYVEKNTPAVSTARTVNVKANKVFSRFKNECIISLSTNISIVLSFLLSNILNTPRKRVTEKNKTSRI
jgi:hypothetical protein